MKNIDTEEIVEVVQSFNGYIKTLCRKFYVAGGTNEDLYQEGFIGLLEACKNYNGESLSDKRFNTFAKICIKRQIFDAIKKTQTQKNKALNEAISFLGVDDSGDEISKIDVVVDRTTISDPLEICLDKEKYDELMEICKNQLSEFELCVLEHYLADEKQSEIATALGKSTKSIDNTLQRIKNKVNTLQKIKK